MFDATEHYWPSDRTARTILRYLIAAKYTVSGTIFPSDQGPQILLAAWQPGVETKYARVSISDGEEHCGLRAAVELAEMCGVDLDEAEG